MNENHELFCDVEGAGIIEFSIFVGKRDVQQLYIVFLFNSQKNIHVEKGTFKKFTRDV